MKIISLNGAWELRIPESEFPVVPANVPGSVYNDLLKNGLMEDPYYRDNEDKALALMEHDFHYSRSFSADEAMLQSDAVVLRCEGSADTQEGCPTDEQLLAALEKALPVVTLEKSGK